MIQVLNDERGYVYAYIEYHILDDRGQFKDGGEYCFVQDLWIHKDYRRTDFNPHLWVLRDLIQKVDKDKFMKDVRWVCWLNMKSGERPTPNYPRERLAKIGA
jgi:hypothetical protein